MCPITTGTASILNHGLLSVKSMKITHKALYNEDCPNYLQLEFRFPCSYNLRLSAAPLLNSPGESVIKSIAAGSVF